MIAQQIKKLKSSLTLSREDELFLAVILNPNRRNCRKFQFQFHGQKYTVSVTSIESIKRLHQLFDEHSLEI